MMTGGSRDMPEAKAILRFVRVAPRKARPVIDMIRGRQVPQAFAMLKHTPRHAAKVVEKLLRSAVANAEQKAQGNLDIDRLFVKTIMVDQGPTLRRFMARAMGRATRINKKTSHVTVELGEMR